MSNLQGREVSLRHRHRAAGRMRRPALDNTQFAVELFGEYKELDVTEQQWFDGQWVPRPTLERFGVLKPGRVEEVGGKEGVMP